MTHSQTENQERILPKSLQKTPNDQLKKTMNLFKVRKERRKGKDKQRIFQARARNRPRQSIIVVNGSAESAWQRGGESDGGPKGLVP